MSLLVVSKLRKIYNGNSRDIAALSDVSFEAQAGDFIALMGPSGCGKSTLLHIIGGMDRPTSGDVTVSSTSLNTLSEEALTRFRRDRIGFVFQFFNLLPTLSVAENVGLPLMLDGTSLPETRKRTRELLERVGLKDRATHFPAELSGGEMQRAAVARAIIARPGLILADEPTGNLDTDNGTQIMNLLADLNKELRITILLATHSANAASYANRTLHMRDGRIDHQE